MADFYVNYGSKGAKLLGNYSFGKINIKLHRIPVNIFVISKNRHIIYECFSFEKASDAFHNAIYLENSSLFRDEDIVKS